MQAAARPYETGSQGPDRTDDLAVNSRSLLPLSYLGMERKTGIEPAFSAWKAEALPLDDFRVPSHRIERHPSRLQRDARTSYASSAKWLRRPESNRRSEAYETPLNANTLRMKWYASSVPPRAVPANQAGLDGL